MRVDTVLECPVASSVEWMVRVEVRMHPTKREVGFLYQVGQR